MGSHNSIIFRRVVKIAYCAACVYSPNALSAPPTDIRNLPTRAWSESVCGTEFSRAELDQAIAACNKAISSDPSNPTLFLTRGDYRLQQHSYDLAIKDLDKAILLAPAIPLVYGRRAAAYELKGDLGNAIKDKSKMIDLLGERAGVEVELAERAELYRLHGNFDLAIEDYNRAIKIDSSRLYIHYRRGYLFEKKGDLGKALADYNHATADRCYAAPYLGRARIYSSQRDFANALVDFSRAIKMSSVDARAYRGRASVLEQTGDLAGAKADLVSAESLSPSFADTEKFDATGSVSMGELKKSPAGFPLPSPGVMRCLRKDE